MPLIIRSLPELGQTLCRGLSVFPPDGRAGGSGPCTPWTKVRLSEVTHQQVILCFVTVFLHKGVPRAPAQQQALACRRCDSTWSHCCSGSPEAEQERAKGEKK